MRLRTVADRVLNVPALYGAYQWLVGAPRCHETFIREYVRPRPGEEVLDIGCGVGASVPHLPANVRYVGLDIDPDYIASARSKHGGRGRFLCADVADVMPEDLGRFDRAFSFGVLHHLDDAAAQRFFGLAKACLRRGGRFVTLDPCLRPDDHPVARYLISQDRGRHVRTEAGYRALAGAHGQVEAHIETTLLNVPYTQIAMAVTF